MKRLPNRLFAPDANSKKADFALLLLRLAMGLTMLFAHGLDKLKNFSAYAEKFPAWFGLSPSANLGLAVFAEVFCAALLAVGLVTRFAALNLCVTMFLAYAVAHKWALTGEGSGEMAFLYLASYLVLLIAGPGRFSADGALFAKPQKPTTGPID